MEDRHDTSSMVAEIDHRIKIRRATKINRFLPMQEKEVWELIPQKLVEELTGEQLALVASAINQSYHNGKAAAGSEVVDEGDNYGAVYVNCIGKMIEWEKAGENLNFFAK